MAEDLDDSWIEDASGDAWIQNETGDDWMNDLPAGDWMEAFENPAEGEEEQRMPRSYAFMDRRAIKNIKKMDRTKFKVRLGEFCCVFLICGYG